MSWCLDPQPPGALCAPPTWRRVKTDARVEACCLDLDHPELLGRQEPVWGLPPAELAASQRGGGW